MRWFSTLCLFAAATGILAAEDKKADEKTSAKTRAIALSLRKPLPAKPGGFAFTPNGVTMDVVVSQPGKYLVALDSKESKLDSFTDDKKNDLYKKAVGIFGGPPPWITDYMTRFSPDGEECTFQITAANPPGKGAEKILVKASLAFQCGLEEKTTEKKEIALKVKEEVSVGDFKMTVNNTGGFGSNLTVQSAKPNIKSVEFFDAAGKTIKVFEGGRGTNPFGPGGKPTSAVYYNLNGKMDKVSFKVTYFNKLESVTVPLDLRVGLDLE